MITSLTSRNHQDWARRYQGTYGWYYKDDGSKLLVYVQRADAREVRFTHDDMEFYARIDTGVKFEFIPVNRMWVNSQSGAIYFLERHPARQWKRGISAENTLIKNARLQIINVSYSVLADIFIDGYDPFAKVDHTADNVALSKNFAITNGKEFRFLDRVAGSVKNKTITLDNDLLMQEVTDMCRRKNYPFKIEVDNG